MPDARWENTYILKHKDISVCRMDISPDGHASNIRYNSTAKSHIPPGASMNEVKFADWWKDRAIPKTRNGASTALQRLGYTSTGNVLVDNLALSLSDCYWICPIHTDLSWNDVNLFTNEFEDTFGSLTFNANMDLNLKSRTRFISATSKGELQKKWCISGDGKRYMVKGNYGDSFQQSINEVFAGMFHEEQGFGNYTKYMFAELDVDRGRKGLGCYCFNFCNEKTEYIPAWDLLQLHKLRQNESVYHALKRVCLEIGMREDTYTEYMDYLILSDYVLTNTDRHMNNIGILRDPDSLELIGFAPIFDTGNSMFYNYAYGDLQRAHFSDIQTCSFSRKEVRNLRYVVNRNAVDTDKIMTDLSIYEKDREERHPRIKELKNLYFRKINSLKAFQGGKNIWNRKVQH